MKFAIEAKKNRKTFYRYANIKTKWKQGLPFLKSADGDEIYNNLNKTEAFNKYFCSVFTSEGNAALPDINSATLSNMHFCVENVKKKLQALKTSKSPGPDQIHLIKKLSAELSSPLQKLFSRLIRQGKALTSWKLGNIISIYKKWKCSYLSI